MLDSFIRQFTKTFLESRRYETFLSGLGTTLTIAIFAVMIGVVIGMFVAILKVYCHQTGRFKVADALCNIYLTLFRGTPVVVQLMILYYIVFINVKNGVYVAIIGFGINSGAYVAEIFRAGIMAVDKGQTEAGRSLGLSAAATMWHIILPQALKNVLPALFNEFIAILKETSVAGYITVIDLTKAGDLVRSRTMQPFFPLLSVAFMYLILVTILTRIQVAIERRLAVSDRR